MNMLVERFLKMLLAQKNFGLSLTDPVAYFVIDFSAVFSLVMYKVCFSRKHVYVDENQKKIAFDDCGWG